MMLQEYTRIVEPCKGLFDEKVGFLLLGYWGLSGAVLSGSHKMRLHYLATEGENKKN